MKLSEAYEAYKQEPDSYVVCVHCNSAWLDDMPQFNELWCPRGCGIMLLRMTNPKVQGYTIETEPREKFGVTLNKPAAEDPGKQSRGFSEVRSRC